MASNASTPSTHSTSNRDPLARRPSFRKSLAEAGLPPHFLETLELKRKQLDDSIHKYIAAKEREYKVFEKEVRAQHRAQAGGDNGIAQSRRRTSGTEEGRQSPLMAPLSAIDALMQKGSRRDSDSHAVETDDRVTLPDRSVDGRLTDRRASLERDKDFVGVFVPPFIPALDTKADGRASSLERTISAPSAVQTLENKENPLLEGGTQRANSDTIIQAPQAANLKRPTHLQLSQRTSSSGSSVEGRLVSAMKSPTVLVKAKRKRVSLAVGDAIVAPSDNVPVGLSNKNTTPSHSRTRTPLSDQTKSFATYASATNNSEEQDVSLLVADRIEPRIANGSIAGGLKAMLNQEMAAANTSTLPPRSVPTQPTGADVGEFWHLEEPDASETEHLPDIDLSDEVDEDLSSTKRTNTIDGCRQLDAPPSDDAQDTSTSPEEASHLEYLPATPTSAQQPSSPGFRRPSVASDPAYSGRDYMRAALNAEESGVYGSSARPRSKGSFTSGSLGESFMARHAEERAARQEAQARS